ncbi:Na/Pi cotransporter family protein [Zeimonas arvi]|uniref:Na/Pi cotransporter family protein n=2 Tax=Zeimonas arvi TaxID=2498847 RepID=A0A5C8P1E2_9BURK|nr:Na/Pi cotransporter family protein [Zeimonas arvi]
MMLLTDGLMSFGGHTIKQALARFTGTPAKAFASGTLATAVAQSSTATTVTLIGFVSAGLVSFPQAIGVLLGASLGNTATGWIVAGLGLKVNLGFYTMPMIGLGALMKLLARGRWAGLGLALAGFGVMFAGLAALQEGMRGLASIFDLASLPVGGVRERLATMTIGLVLTALLQSSTAAIAATLTALHAQAINFDQAAALVVGAAIGTTLTGALVAIAGTVHAKRTALAYVLFNLIAGLVAIALLPVFLAAIEWLEVHVRLEAGAMSLAAFHTLFIAVGVVLLLPFAHPFARLVERLLPARGEVLTERLDHSMLAIPAVALEASQRSLEAIAAHLLALYDGMLSGADVDDTGRRLAQAGQVLDAVYDFVSRIELAAGDEAGSAQRVAQLHAIDHLLRLRTRLDELARARVDLSEPAYEWAMPNTRLILDLARQGLALADLGQQVPQIAREAQALEALSHRMRHGALAGALPGAQSPAQALTRTDAFRWLERIGGHVSRICHYLSEGRGAKQRAATRRRPPPSPA